MLEFKRPEKIQVKIYGDIFEVKPLTVALRDQVLDKYHEMDKDDAKSASEFAKSFVSELGIPRDVIDDMLADHFDSLFKGLVGAEKEKK